MSEKLAKQVQESSQRLQKGIKSRIFDILAAVILVALIALSLGVIERRVITLDEIGDIIVECIPFFFAAMLLNNNYYTKGTFLGKSSQNFLTACEEYNDKITSFTGHQIDLMDEFCEAYNDDALKKKQTTYLNRASISYEKFNNGSKTKDGAQIEPVKVWSKHQIKHTYGKERAKWIYKAKNAEVKGLRVNSLMGTNDNDDATDIGLNESQLHNKRTWVSAITYFASTLIMSMIAVKNVAEWGWFGIALVIYKCIYILVRSYGSYFDGYNDITVHLVHHINRKTDILKQYECWYASRTKIVETTTVTSGNKIENS